MTSNSQKGNQIRNQQAKSSSVSQIVYDDHKGKFFVLNPSKYDGKDLRVSSDGAPLNKYYQGISGFYDFQ